MKSIRTLFKFTIALVVITAMFALLSGCASKSTEGRMLITEEKGTAFAPAWISGDCSAFWGGEQKDRICAVGSSSGSGDIGNVRSQAIEEAHKQVANELEARVQAVVEHYGKSKHGHKDFGNPPNLQLMRKTSQGITTDAMKLSEINGYWITPKNEVYALVSVTATSFEDAVGRMANLSEELRKEMQKRAEKTIAQAEEQIRKELEKEAKEMLEKQSNP